MYDEECPRFIEVVDREQIDLRGSAITKESQGIGDHSRILAEAKPLPMASPACLT